MSRMHGLLSSQPCYHFLVGLHCGPVCGRFLHLYILLISIEMFLNFFDNIQQSDFMYIESYEKNNE